LYSEQLAAGFIPLFIRDEAIDSETFRELTPVAQAVGSTRRYLLPMAVFSLQQEG